MGDHFTSLPVVPVRSYNLAASENWAAFLRHIDFHNGFAFVVLLTPDRSGADVCRETLQEHLHQRSLPLEDLSPAAPKDMESLAGRLLEHTPEKGAGVVWIAAPIPESHNDFTVWRQAVEEGFARLNPHRNTLQSRFPVTVVFVAPNWAQPILRTAAPDLWSVRSMVVRIDPEPIQIEQFRDWSSLLFSPPDPDAPDPDLSLTAAAELRGKAGQEHALVEVLYRAGLGLLNTRRLEESVNVLEEALTIGRKFCVSNRVLAMINLSIAGALRQLLQPSLALERAKEAFHEFDVLEDSKYKAWSLIEIARAQSKIGNLQEALVSAERACSVWREVGEVAGLTEALISVSRYQAALGKLAEALDSSEEAVAVCRSAMASGDNSAKSSLADALFCLSSAQLKNGRFDESRASVIAALAIRRSIPNWTVADIVLDLVRLSTISCRLGDFATAVSSAEEAVSHLQASDQSEAPGLRSLLVQALAALANAQDFAGLKRAARESQRERVSLIRTQTELNREVHLEELASSLTDLADCHRFLGELDEARNAIEEGIAYYRELVRRNPAVFAPKLASALASLSATQSKQNLHLESIKSSEEAVELLAGLPESQKVLVDPALAAAARTVAERYSEAGDHEKALVWSEKALSHFRRLAETDRAVFLQPLASALRAHSSIQASAARMPETIQSAAESIVLEREIANRNPKAFSKDLALRLLTLAFSHLQVNDKAAAAQAASECVAILEKPFEDNPVAIAELYLIASNTLALVQTDSGLPSEAAAIYETCLSKVLPHLPNLEDSVKAIARDVLSSYESSPVEKNTELIAKAKTQLELKP